MREWTLEDSLAWSYQEVLAGPRKLTELADARTAQELWGSAPELPPHDPERLARILDLLPARHADVWELTIQGVSQRGIALLLGWSQVNVSTTLTRAKGSIRLLLSLPDITEAGIERDLSPYLTPEQVRLLCVHFRTSHYLRTAEVLGLKLKSPSIGVKHRLVGIVRRLRKINAQELKPYIDFFSGMVANPVGWGDCRTHRLTKAELAERDGETDEVSHHYRLTVLGSEYAAPEQH